MGAYQHILGQLRVFPQNSFYTIHSSIHKNVPTHHLWDSFLNTFYGLYFDTMCTVMKDFLWRFLLMLQLFLIHLKFASFVHEAPSLY